MPRAPRRQPAAERPSAGAEDPYIIASWESQPHPEGGETITVQVRRRGEHEVHEYSWGPDSHATEEKVKEWLANWASA